MTDTERPVRVDAAFCGVCGSDEARPWGAVRGAGALAAHEFPLVTCVRCGLVYSRPRWASLDALYQEAFRGQHGERFNRLTETIIRWMEDRRARSVARLRAPGALLDIGCGRGIFLAALKRRGWQVAGTEVALGVAGPSHRRQLGVPILAGDFLQRRFHDGQFDVVTLWHVLEHVPDPRATLRKIRQVLRPDGWVLIGVPNLDSWQARWFGARWLHLNPPYHLSQFTVETLRRLLETEAFTIERVQHFHWLWVQNLCGWVQGLLDGVLPTKQLLLSSLQRSFGPWWRAQPAWRRALVAVELVASAALAVLMLPLCLWLMCAESTAQRGGTICVVARPQPNT